MVTKSQQFIIGYHLFGNNSFVCSRFKHNSYMCRRFKINSFVWSRTMKLHPWMNTKPHLWLQCEHLPGCMICVTTHVCPSTHPWHKTDLCLTIMLNIPSGSHSKMESLSLMVSLWSHLSGDVKTNRLNITSMCSPRFMEYCFSCYFSIIIMVITIRINGTSLATNPFHWYYTSTH